MSRFNAEKTPLHCTLIHFDEDLSVSSIYMEKSHVFMSKMPVEIVNNPRKNFDALFIINFFDV